LDSAQFLALGGTAGIAQRCDSQIVVLNADYNRKNIDSAKIPYSWKDSLFGNSGITFGLARVDPYGNCSPGYEIMILPGSSLTDAGFSDIANDFADAKTSGTGLTAWDVSKYYNVWCVNFIDFASGLLGLTVSLSNTGSCLGCFATNQEGAVILYSTLGSTGPDNSPPSGTGTWDLEFGRGRTLTHETGHFFEIWHPWGDDNGQCPTWSSTASASGSGLIPSLDGGIHCTDGIGFDDGLSDTPPESDAVYGSPTYTIAGGTTYDCCEYCGPSLTQPIGIPCLSFMDYTDDTAMHLFTPQQAAAMASMVLVVPGTEIGATGSGLIGENYSLTQHPELLICPAEVRTNNDSNSNVRIFPNPAIDKLNIFVPSEAVIVLSDITGKRLFSGHEIPTGYFLLPLEDLPKGLYIVSVSTQNETIVHRFLKQ
jgi:hypothetical protein